jgi:rubrerythrin
MRSFSAGDFFHVEGTRNPYVRKLCGNYGISGYNMSVLNPVMFQATRLVVHCTEDYIRASFHIPPIEHIRYLCLAPANVQILRNMVSEEMMERLHAGDASGVLQMLGMTARSTEDVTAAVTESIQKELDVTRRLYEFKRTVEYASESAKQRALEQLEDKMARLESRMEAIQDRLKNTQDQSCPICFCEVTNPSLTPCCRNLFCFGCICEVMKRTSVCPLCRESIPNIQAIHVLGAGGAPEVVAEPPKLLTKHEQFRAFLQANPTAKVLMFSAYDATFSGLSTSLEADGIPHATLNGSQARVAKLIRDFDAGKYRVLFLNSRNMGAGLNILPATHVVLFHRMPVEMQNQITGRAMRMGRTEPLTVVHLLHGNEMGAEETLEATDGNMIQHV